MSKHSWLHEGYKELYTEKPTDLYAAVSHLSRVLTQPATFITWTGMGVCLRVPITSTNSRGSGRAALHSDI
jgi:hypothetical protein